MSYRRTRDSQQMGRYTTMRVMVTIQFLGRSQHLEEYLQPIFREEVETAVAALKKEKSAVVDNLPAELVQADVETMIDVLTKICDKI